MVAPTTRPSLLDRIANVGESFTEEERRLLSRINAGRRMYEYVACPYCGSENLHLYQKLRHAYGWETRCLDCSSHLGTMQEQDAAIQRQLSAVFRRITGAEIAS